MREVMKKVKILIVEDEAIIAMDIEKTIIELGHKVTNNVNSTKDIFQSIENDEPDIILMDIDLKQEVDGIEITKKIHQKKYIPVIYLTGYDKDEIMERAIETNPIGYLLKPFNRAEIKSNILIGLSKIQFRLLYKTI
jgi:CheY-like chemotaxis protein